MEFLRGLHNRSLANRLIRFNKPKLVLVFPGVITILLLLLTSLRISGSSIGQFGYFLYGPAYQDKNLILNQPRPIRSDEWLVNTQMTIAQMQADYPRTNHNIGYSQDMSVSFDVPYKEWSTFFKPQNIAFFVLPFEYAFAFKWWLLGYLLMLSCYFFVLRLLPKRYGFAAFSSIALFFSPFIQWWYQTATLAPLFYSLFIITAVMALFEAKNRKARLAFAALLTYLLTSFALVLYPPFQIPCALVILAFLFGYGITKWQSVGRNIFLSRSLYISAAGIVAISIVALFIFTRIDSVQTIARSDYPGQRTAKSGNYDAAHLMSSHLSFQFNSESKTAQYRITGVGQTNQSEGSNFILLLPYLIIPSIFAVWISYRKKQPKYEWMLLSTVLLTAVFSLQLFASWFTPIAHLTLLDRVGTSRMLIGIGLLSLVNYVLLVRWLTRNKFPTVFTYLYGLLVLGVVVLLSWRAHMMFGTFLGPKQALLLSLPIPIVVWLLLRRKFLFAVILYALFSIFSTFRVNPPYKGLSIITSNPISAAVSAIGANTDDRWIGEGIYVENIASINGEATLSGVYGYPQTALWEKIPGAVRRDYNRYAHVAIETNQSESAKTQLSLLSPDSFSVKTSACSRFMKDLDVGYIVTTSTELKGPCVHLEKTIGVPTATFYIYRLDH